MREMLKKNLVTVSCAALLIVIMLVVYFTPLRNTVSVHAGDPDKPDAPTPPATPAPYSAGAAFEMRAMNNFAFDRYDGDVRADNTDLFAHLGEPVLVHLWSSTDEATIEGLETLDRLYPEYCETVHFLIIHTESGMKRATAQALFEERSFSLPLCFDADGSAKRACGAPQTPATYFIDADGFLAAASETPIDEETLRFGLSLLTNPLD